MKKKFYIIPGWEDRATDQQYQPLISLAQKKDYEVVLVEVDWTKPLTDQVFAVEADSVIFGFSLGAILAWLVAQRNTCKHIILASMTPHYSFTTDTIKKDLIEITGEKFVEDVVKNLKSEHKAEMRTIMYGDLEGEEADILVPSTDHEINENYIKELDKII